MSAGHSSTDGRYGLKGLAKDSAPSHIDAQRYDDAATDAIRRAIGEFNEAQASAFEQATGSASRPEPDGLIFR